MEVNKETVNVQQAESLAGQVSSQAVKVQDIVGEAVNEPSAEEQKATERRRALADTLITLDTEVEPLRYSLSVDGVGVFSLLDIHGVKAKQKAG